ncbi:MAG TPA: efflux RND transporter periplasmic adaptor subunit [Bryobacteraceae bacterium]|nr:efflux RND transporter periplasmic adaptor subunit [Bryobacteraceae bacterium]
MKTTTLCVAVLAVLCLTSCSGTEPGRVQAREQKTVSVAAVRAERQDLSRQTELAAEFRPFQEVDVHAKVAGYLKAIYVDVGDRVKQGQLLGVLEVPEYAEELAQATASEKRSELDVVRSRSEVTRAQTALDIQKLSYDRLLSVSKARPNLIAQQEIDTAASRFREADAQLATAKATLAATEQQVKVTTAARSRVNTMMNYLKITAPFSGVVTKRYADSGAMIQAGTASQTQTMPVVRVSQTDVLRLTLPVPESLVARIRTGSPVEVRVDALQRVFQGKVTRFTGRLDSATRTMETEVDLPNPGGIILPGMYGYASLVLDTTSDAVTVPVQAIAGHNTKPTVLVVNRENRLEEREIKLGMETPALVEIKSGVADDELVVIGSRAGLTPGKSVQVKLLNISDLKAGH